MGFLPEGCVQGDVAGVVLAGGRSQRMGSDKASLMLAGRPLVLHAAHGLAAQVEALVVSANGPLPPTGLPVVADRRAGHPGPLAGIDAALAWCAANRPDLAWLATVPCDSPFFPADLVARLRKAAAGRGGAYAIVAGRAEPLFALWPLSKAPDVEQALAAGRGGVGRLLDRLGAAQVVFPADMADRFVNLNTPEEFARLQARLAMPSGLHGGAV